MSKRKSAFLLHAALDDVGRPYQLDDITVPEREVGKCVICGAPVRSNMRMPTNTCSPECRRKRLLDKKREHRERLKKGKP